MKKTLEEKSLKANLDYNKNIIITCLVLYGDYSPMRNKLDISKIPSREEYIKIMSKLNTTKYPHKTRELLPHFFNTFGLVTCKNHRFIFLENIIEIYKLDIKTYIAILKWIEENLNNIAFETLYIITYYVMHSHGSYVSPEIRTIIHKIFTTKILTDEKFHNSTSLSIWSLVDKKTYSHWSCEHIPNHQYYSNNINNMRALSVQFGYSYLLSLTAFTLEEMVGLHLSGDIDYLQLEEFPTIEKNIIWIIHREIVGNSKAIIRGYGDGFNSTWKDLLKPYWSKEHKIYEQKKHILLQLQHDKKCDVKNKNIFAQLWNSVKDAT